MGNPFVDDIFAVSRSWKGSVPLVLQPEALAVLRAMLGDLGGAMGRSLVVSAPRAGFGMTHLMARFADVAGGRALVVPLVFDLESPPRWGGVLEQVGRKLHGERGPRPGLTRLDESARFLMAQGTRRLIADGLVPCSHPVEVMAALERNFLEMFDFGDGDAAVARWFGERFESLARPMGVVLGPEVDVGVEAVAHWLRVLLAYAQGVTESPGRRWEAWQWAVSTSAGAALGGGGIIQDSASPEEAAKDTLRDLGRLLSLHRPLVFVIDHLDAFYGDESAGLRIAYLVSELRRLLPRSLSVVCVNDDMWRATFQDRLPSALEDRMVGGRVALRGLIRDQAIALVEERLASAGVETGCRDRLRGRLDWDDFLASQDGHPVSPRAVLRHAAWCWDFPEGADPSAVSPGVPMPAPRLGVSGPRAETGLTPSVLGEKTLDSISAALQAMVSAGTADQSEASSGPTALSFQRLREKIERLRPLGAAPAATPARASAMSGVAVPPSEGVLDLPGVFTESHRRWEEAPVPPALDLERLGRMLQFAGEHFPAVRGTALALPGTRGRALQWLAPDAEILIGLESLKRSIFWSALAAHAAARVKLNGGLPVKVVALADSASEAPPVIAGNGVDGFTVDLVVLTVAELRQLAAACDVLEAVASGELQAGAQDLVTLLAQVLDPFWRRLTRLTMAPGA